MCHFKPLQTYLPVDDIFNVSLCCVYNNYIIIMNHHLFLPTVGPAITISRLSLMPTLSESFSLLCTATAFLSQNVTVITWFHNGTEVNINSDNVTITTQTQDDYTTNSTLTVMSAQARDSGNYSCVASSQIYDNVSSEVAVVYVLSKFVCRLVVP